MAETRTFDPGDPQGLQKLVREALGETIRPDEPGRTQQPANGAQETVALVSDSTGQVPEYYSFTTKY